MSKIIKAVILIFIFCNIIKIHSKIIKFNYHNPYVKSVNLVGSFNNWDVNNLSMKPDNKGHWKVEIDLPAGTHYYKFVIENNKWISDPINPKINRQNNNNSVIEISEKEEKEYFYQIQRDKKKRIYKRIKKEYEDPKIQEAIGKLDFDDDGISNSQDNDIDGDSITNDKDDDIDGDGILNKDDPAPTDWREIGYQPFGVNSHYHPYDTIFMDVGIFDYKNLNNILNELISLGIDTIRYDMILAKFDSYDIFNGINHYTRLSIELKNRNISPLFMLFGIPGRLGQNRYKNSKDWIDACYRPPQNYDELNSFIFNLVSQFKNFTKYWQIWNETNLVSRSDGTVLNPKEYTQILKNIYLSIKKADPSAIVILEGLAPIPKWKNYLIKLFELNANNYFDILALHTYGINVLNSKDAQEYIYANLVKYIGDYPIWITENGSSIIKDTENNCEKQSLYLINMYSTLLKFENIEKIYWYQLIDQYPENKINESFGLLNSNFVKRKSYFAYKDIIDEYKKYVR